MLISVPAIINLNFCQFYWFFIYKISSPAAYNEILGNTCIIFWIINNHSKHTGVSSHLSWYKFLSTTGFLGYCSTSRFCIRWCTGVIFYRKGYSISSGLGIGMGGFCSCSGWTVTKIPYVFGYTAVRISWCGTVKGYFFTRYTGVRPAGTGCRYNIFNCFFIAIFVVPGFLWIFTYGNRCMFRYRTDLLVILYGKGYSVSACCSISMGRLCSCPGWTVTEIPWIFNNAAIGIGGSRAVKGQFLIYRSLVRSTWIGCGVSIYIHSNSICWFNIIKCGYFQFYIECSGVIKNMFCNRIFRSYIVHPVTIPIPWVTYCSRLW